MSAYILCQVRRAQTPLRVEALDLNLWSIEELCYFLNHDLSLLEEDFFGDTLLDWIREELDLPELAEKLEGILAEDCALDEVVLPIMDEIGYLDAAERAELERRVRKLEQEPEVVRQKQRGDVLAGQKKYLRAIEIYQRILSLAEEKAVDERFLGAVNNNMGVAYARLFLMDEAIDYMRRAHELLHTPESLKNCLACARMQGGEAALRQMGAELGVGAAALAEMNSAFEAAGEVRRPDDLPEALHAWVAEYHRTAGM